MTNEILKVNPFEISTFEQAERYAKLIADSDFAPKDYKGKPGNVMIAMQMGYEIGLKPSQAIQNIAVVNGRPMVYGDAALALVRGNPQCEGIREWMEGTIKGGDAIAYCEVKRGKEITQREFSVKQAMQASLIGKQGPWTQYPERMLQMRARGFALRDAFPDVLKGVYVEGEMDEVTDEAAVIDQKDSPKLGIAAVKQAIAQPTQSEPATITGEVVNPVTGEVTPPPSGGPSLDEVKNQMENAKTVDELICAKDLARTSGFTPEQISDLAKLYKRKQTELGG